MLKLNGNVYIIKVQICGCVWCYHPVNAKYNHSPYAINAITPSKRRCKKRSRTVLWQTTDNIRFRYPMQRIYITRFHRSTRCFFDLNETIKKRELWWCQRCHHWWHCRLPVRQPAVPSMKTKLALGKLFFSLNVNGWKYDKMCRICKTGTTFAWLPTCMYEGLLNLIYADTCYRKSHFVDGLHYRGTLLSYIQLMIGGVAITISFQCSS